MDIFSHPKTINVHNITLNDMEVSDILVEPEPFFDKLRGLLDRPAIAEKKTSRPRRAKTGRKAKSRKLGALYKKTPCEHCHRPIAAYMMANHIRKTHPEVE